MVTRGKLHGNGNKPFKNLIPLSLLTHPPVPHDPGEGITYPPHMTAFQHVCPTAIGLGNTPIGGDVEVGGIP